MSSAKYVQYIDTNVSGLVVQVEHNLGGTPLIGLTDYTSGSEVFVSFYDPRIAEIKVLDDNTVQLTFSSAFEGYAIFHHIINDQYSLEDRVKVLEDKYIQLLQTMSNFATKAQWSQMNTLLSKQIELLNSKVDTLQNQVDLLSDAVDSL